MTDEPEPRLTDERTSAGELPTFVDEPEGGPVEEGPEATIVDESSTILNEPDDEGPESDSPRLDITDGQTTRVIITERTGPFIVGRDPSRSNLAVDDGRASRKHFSITEHDGIYYITDLGSSNGTFLNGALVKGEARLSDGDTIEFGRTVATFRM